MKYKPLLYKAIGLRLLCLITSFSYLMIGYRLNVFNRLCLGIFNSCQLVHISLN